MKVKQARRMVRRLKHKYVTRSETGKAFYRFYGKCQGIVANADAK